MSWHTGIFQKIRHCIKLVVFLIKSLLLTNLGENILVHGKNKLLLMNIYHHFFIWIRNLLPNQIEYWVVFPISLLVFLVLSYYTQFNNLQSYQSYFFHSCFYRGKRGISKSITVLDQFAFQVRNSYICSFKLIIHTYYP